MKRRRALVTGGSGFIGRHVVEHLLLKNFDVRVLDRLSPPNKDVNWIDGDLRWIGDCQRATDGVDIVLHLAARISVDQSLEYVREYFQDNVLGTINICEAAKDAGVEKVVFTSSCEVYGNIKKGRASESHPCEPDNPYGASKFAAERAAIACCRDFGIPLVVLRPFNTFGPGQKGDRGGAAIPTFLGQALRGKELVIHGDGSQIRDFVYVDDVARAHILAIESNPRHFDVVNIASGIGRSVAGVANEIVRITNSRSKVVHVQDPRRDAQVTRSVGDASKARMVLGWTPSWDFATALRHLAEETRRGLRAD